LLIWDWFSSGYGGYPNGGAANQPNTGDYIGCLNKFDSTVLLLQCGEN